MGLPMPVPPQHGGLLLGVALQPRTLSPQTGTPASDAAVGEFHVTLTPDQVNWLVSSCWKFQGSFLSPVFTVVHENGLRVGSFSPSTTSSVAQ